MGPRTAWLDGATKICLTSSFSLRYYEPDLVIHECVPGFTGHTLLTVLNSEGGQLKSVFTPAECCPFFQVHHANLEYQHPENASTRHFTWSPMHSAFYLEPYVTPLQLDFGSLFFVVFWGGIVKILRRSNSLSRSVFSTAGSFGLH